MRRRTRFFAGIFALVAMTGALAEGVLASACAPGMEMGDDAMSVVDGARHDGDCMLDMVERGEREDLPDDRRHCPFTPLAAQGCLAIASIPATGVSLAEPSARTGAGVVFDDEQHDLLIEAALFHPPRQ